MAALNGFKTYIVAALGVAAAAYGYETGALDPSQALQAIITALGLSTLRHGIATSAK